MTTAKKVKKPTAKKPATKAAGKKAAPKVKKVKEVEILTEPDILDDDLKLALPPGEHSGKNLPEALDSLQKYLADLRKYPLLTPEEEHKLAVKYHETGDREAAEKLVTANLRFVVKVAAEYSRFGARMIDLIQEGNVGLMNAVKEFNPYKGVRLITYAVWWIRGYIQEYLMKNFSQVKIGTTQAQKKLFYHLNREKARLDAIGEPPDAKLLSSRLGVTEKELEEMTQRMGSRDVSLDAPVGEDDGARRFMESQADVNAESADDALAHSEEHAIFQKEIGKVASLLNEKEKYILDHRILGDPPATLQDVGDHFKITRERARQLEERTIQKIREHFKTVFPDYKIDLPKDD